VWAFLDKDVAHKEPEDVAIFDRVALTAEQVGLYDLPTAPPKESSHSKKWRGGETCQLEALPPDELADVLNTTVLRRFDVQRLDRDLKAEITARRKIVRALPGGGDSPGGVS